MQVPARESSSHILTISEREALRPPQCRFARVELHLLADPYAVALTVRRGLSPGRAPARPWLCQEGNLRPPSRRLARAELRSRRLICSCSVMGLKATSLARLPCSIGSAGGSTTQKRAVTSSGCTRTGPLSAPLYVAPLRLDVASWCGPWAGGAGLAERPAPCTHMLLDRSGVRLVLLVPPLAPQENRRPLGPLRLGHGPALAPSCAPEKPT